MGVTAQSLPTAEFFIYRLIISVVYLPLKLETCCFIHSRDHEQRK